MFDSSSSIANQLCPQNLFTSFSGPGAYKSGGRGESSNSTFITVAPVPEDLTIVTVTGQRLGYWINSHSAKVNFLSMPPALASKNNFVAAPIQSITYGISLASNVPQPGSPVPDDVTVPNSACPTPGGSNPPKATPFTALGKVSASLRMANTRCITLPRTAPAPKNCSSPRAAGSWSTSFYTFPINVDTVAPVVETGPTLSPAPHKQWLYRLVRRSPRLTAARTTVQVLCRCGTALYLLGTAEHGHDHQLRSIHSKRASKPSR